MTVLYLVLKESVKREFYFWREYGNSQFLVKFSVANLVKF